MGKKGNKDRIARQKRFERLERERERARKKAEKLQKKLERKSEDEPPETE
jgi:hypothetical protein